MALNLTEINPSQNFFATPAFNGSFSLPIDIAVGALTSFNLIGKKKATPSSQVVDAEWTNNKKITIGEDKHTGILLVSYFQELSVVIQYESETNWAGDIEIHFVWAKQEDLNNPATEDVFASIGVATINGVDFPLGEQGYVTLDIKALDFPALAPDGLFIKNSVLIPVVHSTTADKKVTFTCEMQVFGK